MTPLLAFLEGPDPLIVLAVLMVFFGGVSAAQAGPLSVHSEVIRLRPIRQDRTEEHGPYGHRPSRPKVGTRTSDLPDPIVTAGSASSSTLPSTDWLPMTTTDSSPSMPVAARMACSS